MTRLDDIPTVFAPPAQARPSAVVARIRAIRPSRRAVLRGLVIGAAAAALVPLDWYLARRQASADPEEDDKSEHLGCVPESYDEEANNWPEDGEALCFGGWRRGSYPCSEGYHREGTYEIDGDSYESTRLTTSCHGKNGWRWRGHRCSDAVTEVYYDDGDIYRGVTIAACELLPDTEAAAGSVDTAAVSPAGAVAPASTIVPAGPSATTSGTRGQSGQPGGATPIATVLTALVGPGVGPT